MISQSSVRNNLLALIRPEDFALLAAHLEPIKLPKGHGMANPGEVFPYVYFLESGMASIVATSPEGQEVEAGIIGREGVVPIEAVAGSDQGPNRVYIQIAGDGHRMERTAFAEALLKSATMQALFLRFLLALNAQTTYTALANAVHQVDERLARWLLMCFDRVDGTEIPLTHEFISLMLAVRRPSVTTSLHVLEGNGFIRAERGWITILNREAMEEFAGDAYGKPEAEYWRLLGKI